MLSRLNKLIELNKIKGTILKLPKLNNYFYLNEKKYNLEILNYFLEVEKEDKIKKSISILDLCINLNCIIPHYCYHFNLSIAGNCRMCLVELNASLKPIASCALEVLPKMKIKTNTFLVNRAREGIMEFLLINHPLDCPVCDQGGECDLQDQSLVYGNDRGRFYLLSDYNKRAITDLMFNPFVKLILTRCIFCTRCIRFLNEIGGENRLGLLGRGSHSEISLYTTNEEEEKSGIISELGSNIMDFCPVGALTSKNYGLNYRSWDDMENETIDLNDSLCSSIRVYSSQNEIIRIVPRYESELKISWITEKTRYLIDGLKSQQMEYPMYNNSKTKLFFSLKSEKRKNFFVKISWNNLTKIFDKYYINSNLILNKNFLNFQTFLGDFLDIFTLIKIKEYSLLNGNNLIYSFMDKLMFSYTNLVNEDFDFNYIYSKLNLNKYKNILLINLNLRIENPILNARLRQKFIWEHQSNFFYLGSKYNLTYKYIHLGTTTKILLKMVEGRNFLFNFLTRKLTKETLLLYSSELKKCYKNTFYRSFFNYLRKLNQFFDINFLVMNSSSMSYLDLSMSRYLVKNITNLHNSSLNTFFCNYYIGCNQYLLGANDFLSSNKSRLSIYQNFINDEDYFTFIDFILPVYYYYYKQKQFYINCFGILKMSRKIFFGSSPFIKDNSELISFFNKKFLKSNLLVRNFLKEKKYFFHIYFINNLKRKLGYKKTKRMEHLTNLINNPTFFFTDLDRWFLFKNFYILKMKMKFFYNCSRFFFIKKNSIIKKFLFIKNKRCPAHLIFRKYREKKSLHSVLFNMNLFELTVMSLKIVRPGRFFFFTNVISYIFFDLYLKGLKKINFSYNININTYIPIYLYDKRRFKFFNIFDTKIFYSFIYFYLLSSKSRNFFKTSMLTYYSANMNNMSSSFFSNKSNFNI